MEKEANLVQSVPRFEFLKITVEKRTHILSFILDSSIKKKNSDEILKEKTKLNRDYIITCREGLGPKPSTSHSPCLLLSVFAVVL